jgi:DNA-binding phage protein
MSITVELPPDLEQQIQAIPDLGRRIAAFLRNQIEYENWRKQRYSERARGILEASRAEVEKLKTSGMTRDDLFREFMELHENITRSL